MKKTMFGLLLGLGVSFAVMGESEEINFNKNFETNAKGDVVSWEINKLEEYEPWGKAEVIKGKDGENSLKLISMGKDVHYYCTAKFPITGNEKLKIEAKISGKGQIALGAYFYGETKFAYGEYPMFAIPEKVTKVEKTFLLRKPAAGEQEVKFGVIVIAITAGSEAVISNLDAEVITPESD